MEEKKLLCKIGPQVRVHIVSEIYNYAGPYNYSNIYCTGVVLYLAKAPLVFKITNQDEPSTGATLKQDTTNEVTQPLYVALAVYKDYKI